MFEFIRKLQSIDEIKSLYPSDEKVKAERDGLISDILLGRDNRFLLLVGPCSMDSEYGIYLYIDKLMKLNEKIKRYFYVVPRLYTSKPRSLSGFRGLIHSPYGSVSDSFDNSSNDFCNGFFGGKTQNISDGIRLCRKILSRIVNDYGLTGADELLYPELFGYFDDLISYAAVGARSTENQQHRMYASGLEIAVGFKNPLSGNIKSLINSVCVSRSSNDLSVCGSEYRTIGNKLSHAVFRGYTQPYGGSIANADLAYFTKFLELQSERELLQNEKSLLPIPFLVDASHDNSGKDYLKQGDILNQIAKNLQNNDYKKLFKGIMLESYLVEGKNTDTNGEGILGLSKTDGCLSFEQTEKIVLNFLDKIG